jgi:hypothetical protein
MSSTVIDLPPIRSDVFCALSSTWALVCAGVQEASMPMTLRSRPSAAKPTTMPAWVDPVTVQTIT